VESNIIQSTNEKYVTGKKTNEEIFGDDQAKNKSGLENFEE
jgi:hypothetical protein